MPPPMVPAPITAMDLISRLGVSSGPSGILEAPRPAVGLSEDRRYLYLSTIDGRQPGYSNGALPYDTAARPRPLGGCDGFNLHGGGSETLVHGPAGGRAGQFRSEERELDDAARNDPAGALAVHLQAAGGFQHRGPLDAVGIGVGRG